LSSRRAVLCVALMLGACGPAAAGGGGTTLASRPLPADQNERLASVDQLGEQLYGVLTRGSLGDLWANGNDLDQLFTVNARAKRSAGRGDASHVLAEGGWGQAWVHHPYGGFCAQGGREEPANGPLGLKEPTWVLDRVLVVAADGHRRAASWVDGLFVYTTRGWIAVDLHEAESPRPDHSDLELAPCDVQRGIR